MTDNSNQGERVPSEAAGPAANISGPAPYMGAVLGSQTQVSGEVNGSSGRVSFDPRASNSDVAACVASPSPMVQTLFTESEGEGEKSVKDTDHPMGAQKASSEKVISPPPEVTIPRRRGRTQVAPDTVEEFMDTPSNANVIMRYNSLCAARSYALPESEFLKSDDAKNALGWWRRQKLRLMRSQFSDQDIVRILSMAMSSRMYDKLDLGENYNPTVAEMEQAIEKLTSARHPIVDRLVEFHKGLVDQARTVADARERAVSLIGNLKRAVELERTADGKKLDPWSALLVATFVEILPTGTVVPAASTAFSSSAEVFMKTTIANNLMAPSLRTSKERSDVLVIDGKRVKSTHSNRPTTCFKCGGLGHFAADCPVKIGKQSHMVCVPHKVPMQPGKRASELKATNASHKRRKLVREALHEKCATTTSSPHARACSIIVVNIYKLLTCVMRVGGELCVVLVDTCAAVSLCDTTIAGMRGVRETLDRDGRIELVGIDAAGSVRTTGTVQVRLTACQGRDTWEHVQNCGVTDLGGRGQILLGSDFLRQCRPVISYEREVISLPLSGSRRVELPFRPETEPCEVEQGTYPLLTTGEIDIPPMSQKVVDVVLPLGDKRVYGVIYAESSQVAAGESALLCCKGWPLVRGNHTRVLVVNASHQTRRVRKGTEVGIGHLQHSGEELTYVPCALLNDEVEPVGTKSDQEEDRGAIPPDLDLAPAMERLTRSEFRQLKLMLQRHHRLWRREGEQLGQGVPFEHEIELVPGARPYNERPRRLGPEKEKAAREEVQRMKDLNVIQASKSPWAAAAVLVRKKDGSWRFCVDYRGLNDRTVKDVYPLPRCDDLLAALHGKKYFSAMDLESGYWQTPVREQDRPLTAFITPEGLWEYKNMPFGLCNAPATFQRMMDAVLAGAKWNWCLVYLDDILVISKTFQEHVKHLDDVFTRLEEARLKLKAKKCSLLRRELLFLGHIIAENGIRPNPAKVKVLEHWPVPKTVKEVESFLGLATYFRKFVPGFAKIAAPLNELKKNEFRWTESQQRAFDILRKALMTDPVLMHPDLSKPFSVETDASGNGLGAVLLQRGDDGEDHVIEYASRTLRKHEVPWTPREWEALAILWACELWRHYLEDRAFVVKTDHKSLNIKQWLKDHKNHGNYRLERWLHRLSPFNFEVEYRTGRSNLAADGLSRSGLDVTPEGLPSDEIPEAAVLCTGGLDLSAWREAQQLDKGLRWLTNTGSPESGSRRKRRNQERLREEYDMKEGLVHRKGALVVPAALIASVIKSFHEPAHLGAAKILPEIAKRFWWKGMSKDVAAFCRGCLECMQASRYNSERQGFLKPLIAPRRWHTVNLDLYGPIEGGDGCRYVLVTVDHFSKWVILSPLCSKRAGEVRDAFLRDVVYQHGVPVRVVTDQGTEFLGEFAETCQTMGIAHHTTTAYHQQANGQVERFMQVLGKLQRIWENRGMQLQDKLAELAFGYNTSWHPAIDNTPFFVERLRDPRLPVDNHLQLSGLGQLEEGTLETALELRRVVDSWAEERTTEVQRRMQREYDARQRSSKIEIGSMVLVREESGPLGVAKGRMRWSPPYRVLEVKDEGLNVVVAPINAPGKPQTVTVQRLRKFEPSDLNPWVVERPMSTKSPESHPKATGGAGDEASAASWYTWNSMRMEECQIPGPSPQTDASHVAAPAGKADEEEKEAPVRNGLGQPPPTLPTPRDAVPLPESQLEERLPGSVRSNVEQERQADEAWSGSPGDNPAGKNAILEEVVGEQEVEQISMTPLTGANLEPRVEISEDVPLVPDEVSKSTELEQTKPEPRERTPKGTELYGVDRIVEEVEFVSPTAKRGGLAMYEVLWDTGERTFESRERFDRECPGAVAEWRLERPTPISVTPPRERARRGTQRTQTRTGRRRRA